MFYTISNECLTFCASDLGAEPESLTTNGRQWLNQIKNDVGTGLSPVLFPIIGPYADDEHPLPMHGFAKTSVFKTENITDSSITFVLDSDETTMKMYPYEFRLSVVYTLDGNRLITEYKVENKGEKPMYYAIGSHIGFCLNTQKENYTMVFDSDMEQNKEMVVYNACQEFVFDGNILDIKDNFFKKGCITIGNHKSKSWRFVNKTDNSVISYESEDFPYLTLWSIPKKPFICLESWSFRSGHFCGGDSIKDLPEICTLNPKDSKSYKYILQFESEN